MPLSEGQLAKAKTLLASEFFKEEDVVSAAGNYYFFETLLKGGEMKAAVQSVESLGQNLSGFRVCSACDPATL